jgi:hypothetical protein
MATPIVVGDIIAVRGWTQFAPQAAVNTFNFQCTAITGTGATDAVAASQFDLLLSTFYPTIICDQASYRGVQVYFLKRTGILPLPAQSNANTAAGIGGTLALPRNTAAILKYATLLRGPGGRGRLYLPFLPTDTMTAQGDPTAGFNTFVTNFGATLLTPTIVGTGPNTSTLVWSLAHRGPVITSTPIATARSADKFGQMHKRGDYGRPNSSPV